jgi:hypothetical protein
MATEIYYDVTISLNTYAINLKSSGRQLGRMNKDTRKN